MNIKDFLLDNYIYIIIVIILIIITIIGFLADKQKNGGKKNKAAIQPMPNNMEGMIVNQPITYQPVNNQMGNMNTVPNQVVSPTPSVAPINNQVNIPNNNVAANQNDMQAIPNNNIAMNNIGNINQNMPQPVESMNVGPITQPEPMYQPLSEQKPIIKPTNPNVVINNLENNNLNNQVVPSAEPMQQPIVDNSLSSYSASPNMYNQPAPVPTPIVATQPVMNEVTPNVGMQPGPMAIAPQPIPTPSDNVMPTPIAPPQPVMPQSMPNPNNGMVQNPVAQQPVMPQSVGFVYGPQTPNQNNNIQM